jgi:hypothetical protein
MARNESLTTRRGIGRRLASSLALRSDLGACLFLGGVVLLFFWPAWTLNYRSPIGGGDLWGQLYPVWSYVAEWLMHGKLALWSTRAMGGDPIVAEMQYGLLNPLNWPLFLHFPIASWLVVVRSAVPIWLAGAGLYLYLRRSPVWKLSRASAIAGAVVYMLSDPFVAHLGHPQFSDTMAWVPWALLGIDGAMRQRRRIPAAAFAVTALVLAGHGQAALYALMLLCVYAAWQVLEGGSASASRRLGRLGLVAILAAMLAAPATLPALQRLPRTTRASMPASTGEYEFHPSMWLDFITPLFHGRSPGTFWGPWERVETGSVGVAALTLAAAGLTANHRRRTVFLWVLGIGAVLFALGTQGPIYRYLERLPFFDATWKTGRAIFVLSLVLAIAAAQGMQRLLGIRAGTRWGIAALGFAVVVAVSAPAWAARAPDPATSTRALSGFRLASGLLAAAGTVALLVRRRALVQAALIGLTLAELIATGALADAEAAPSPTENPHAAAEAFLAADTGWFRVDVDGKAHGLWSPASLMTAGFEVPQGTGNPMELVVYTQFYWGIPHKGMPAYNLLGTKYIVVPKDAQPGANGIWPVYAEDPLVDIHLNTNALTRVWLVYETIPVETLEAAYALVYSPDFRPAAVATVRGGHTLDTASAGAIEVLAYEPNRARFAVRTDEPALLVLSDLLYPGWTARVNGRRTAIYPTNGIFRGVYVPSGTSTVVMRFMPDPLKLGMGLLLCGLLSIVAILRPPRSRVSRTTVSLLGQAGHPVP